MSVPERLKRDVEIGILPQKYSELIHQFYTSYIRTNEQRGQPLNRAIPIFHLFIDLVEKQVKTPYQFEPHHEMITSPIDYHRFGIDVIEGVVDEKGSTAGGLEYATRIEEQLAQGDNVVLLANHQTECDPIALNILLTPTHPHLGRDTISVAGERVLNDPMAAPFSMGLNLLCVYSKKYIDNPPEKRLEKQSHNAKTMKMLFKLLEEGGKSIYVAPSGGRDRPNEKGEIVPAPFDGGAIELFRLIAKKCSHPVHFYPLALATYNILPPPRNAGSGKWEPRYTEGGPIHLNFGAEIDFEAAPGVSDTDKRKRRELIGSYAWQLVDQLYSAIPKENS